jgi:hypothetical protein
MGGIRIYALIIFQQSLPEPEMKKHPKKKYTGNFLRQPLELENGSALKKHPARHCFEKKSKILLVNDNFKT